MKEIYKCPNCFQGDIQSGKCTACGYERKDDKENCLRLPEMYILENRYIIGRILGNGGFGITYKAFDILNQCYCAVKEFVPLGVVKRIDCGVQMVVTSSLNLDDFEHGKKRFMQEAQVLKQLTDIPEVVQVMDYFLQNNTAYFVMEHIEGANLKQLMTTYGGTIPLKEASSIIYHAGMALDQVHKRAGIFHRDISPDNIMVSKDGKVKIIDFGNAKHIIGNKSQTLSVILKHGYAPLEQYSSTGSQGSYTDVYALAVTFYYIVTGRMIPDAPDRLGGIEYAKLKELNLSVSQNISDAVDCALMISSKARTQSVAEFIKSFSSAEKQRVQRRLKPYLKLAGTANHIWSIPENKIVRIGRSVAWADIIPSSDAGISNKHCELFYDSMEQQFYLIDHSTNGTYVGNKKLVENEVNILFNGERFTLGNHICDLEVGWNE